MQDHESTHNPPISISNSQQSLFPSEGVSDKPVPERDDMFNYQCSLLEYGMLSLNFFHAIREGRGFLFGRRLAIFAACERLCRQQLKESLLL